MRRITMSLMLFAGLLLMMSISGAFSLASVASNFTLTAEGQVYLPMVMRQSPPTPTPTPTPTATPTPPTDNWLTRVNELRAMANLPAVTENTEWTQGCIYHSRYVVKNDNLTHYEDPNNPWYTPEGDAAGRNGNVMCSSNMGTTDVYAINLWMVGPFHGLGIVDARLQQVAFGSYREAIGMWQMAATLDVLRGINWSANPTYPVFWPADDKTVDLSRYTGSEWPDPLSSCPGYTAPTGLPIIVQFGKGSNNPAITAHSFKQGNTALDHCVFDETSYTNPDSSAQSLARSVLGGRDAVIIIPKQPLTPGQSYTVSLTNNGTTYIWSFTVAATTYTLLDEAPTR